MTAGQPNGGGEAMRLDKWLWHARCFKSRSLASAFCESVGVRIGGQPVRKAHYQLRIGDVLTFASSQAASRDASPHVRVLRVRAFSPRRLSAPLARELYDDLSPPPPARDESRPLFISVGEREPGSGRPTKADRRATTRLKGGG